MTAPHDELARWAEVLDASGDYKVLRRLGDAPVVPRAKRADERIGIVVDTETTGLDVESNEVIELGMLAFTYSVGGQITEIIDTFEGLREPVGGIPEEITKITGLTLADLRGHQIDIAAVQAFVEQADLIIAHNAAFDRPFCEALCSSFEKKPWACSATEVAWRDAGFDGVKLTYLITQCGYFYDGHRALDDSFALFRVLSHPLPGGETSFKQLLDSARKPTFRIQVPAPFEVRELLRKGGYRWKAHGDPSKRCWHIEVPEDRLDSEMKLLQAIKEIDQRGISVEQLTALTRYR